MTGVMANDEECGDEDCIQRTGGQSNPHREWRKSDCKGGSVADGRYSEQKGADPKATFPQGFGHVCFDLRYGFGNLIIHGLKLRLAGTFRYEV